LIPSAFKRKENNNEFRKRKKVMMEGGLEWN